MFFEKQCIEKAKELSEEEEIALFREKYAVLLQTAIEASEEQVELLQEEVERLRGELQQRVDFVRDQERKKAADREQQLVDEIIKLNRQMARLEVRMEMLQESDKEDDEG